jgi:hypothetical protein
MPASMSARGSQGKDSEIGLNLGRVVLIQSPFSVSGRRAFMRLRGCKPAAGTTRAGVLQSSSGKIFKSGQTSRSVSAAQPLPLFAPVPAC